MELCAICLQPLTICSQCIRTPCSHTFHRICLSRMMQFHSEGATNRRRLPCPLCRAHLSTDVENASLVESGLPAGTEEDIRNLLEEYNSPVRHGETRTRRSPVQIIRTMVRGRRRRRRGLRSHTTSLRVSRRSLDMQLTESLRQEMQIQVREQRILGEQMTSLERILGVNQIQADARERYAELLDRVLRLGGRQRTLINLLTDERTYPRTRERILAAWMNAWSQEDQEGFFVRQNNLILRMAGFRQVFEERGRDHIFGVPSMRYCFAAVVWLVAGGVLWTMWNLF